MKLRGQQRHPPPLILPFNFLTDARFPNPFGCFYFHSPFDQFAHLGIDQFMA
jgi:hypothetical protein